MLNLVYFSHVEFQELMSSALEHLQTQLENKNGLYVSLSISLLTLGISVLLLKGNTSYALFFTVSFTKQIF